MAERRMFAKSLIGSDVFMELPLSAQALYLHLAIQADDDGLVNSHKRIQRMIGASEEDMQQLFEKELLISFESGIVAIRHWKLHNFIRRDRYRESVYKKERAMLEVTEDLTYVCNNSVQNNNVQIVTTQDRLGKDRLGKDRSGEGDAPAAAPPSFEKEMLLIQEQYNRICTALPRCMRLSENRKKQLAKTLTAGKTAADFEAAFRKAQASAFLKGGNARGWAADFDWLIREQNMDKVLEGSYDDRPAVPKGATGTLGQAELEAIQRVLQEK